MSNKYKCVQITLEESLYDFLNKYIDTYLPDIDISYLIKCAAINRFMSIGVLNEVGLPNQLVLPPTIDFSNFEDGINLSALRSVCPNEK